MKYYRMSFDDSVADACYLSRLRTQYESVDPRLFTSGQRLGERGPTFILSVEKNGRVLDVNFSGFDMPVVSSSVLEAISSTVGSDIETFRVCIDGVDDASMHIMNVVHTVDCFDRDRSFFTEWQEGEFRNDKVGKPKMVVSLAILPDRAGGHHIFRVKDWLVALIVSDVVREALQTLGAEGARFTPVT